VPQGGRDLGGGFARIEAHLLQRQMRQHGDSNFPRRRVVFVSRTGDRVAGLLQIAFGNRIDRQVIGPRLLAGRDNRLANVGIGKVEHQPAGAGGQRVHERPGFR